MAHKTTFHAHWMRPTTSLSNILRQSSNVPLQSRFSLGLETFAFLVYGEDTLNLESPRPTGSRLIQVLYLSLTSCWTRMPYLVRHCRSPRRARSLQWTGEALLSINRTSAIPALGMPENGVGTSEIGYVSSPLTWRVARHLPNATTRKDSIGANMFEYPSQISHSGIRHPFHRGECVSACTVLSHAGTGEIRLLFHHSIVRM